MRIPATPAGRLRWQALVAALAISGTCLPRTAQAAQAPSSAGGRATLALAQRPAAQVRGVVRDDRGRGLPGVRLTLEGGELEEPRTAVSDAEGRFVFGALPPGQFELHCNAAGFEPWRRMIRLAPDDNLPLDITMRQALTAPGPGEPPDPSRSGGQPQIVRPPQPGAGADPSDPRHELLDEIDAYLAQLDLGTIAFNAPDTMRFGESTQIRLLLSPSLSIEELQQKLGDLPGTPQGAEIKIAPRMEAVLTGQQFSITAITPAAQAVSREMETEWRWEVSPTSAGRHRLHLALNALILDTPRSLRTFEQTIEVDVTLGQQISGFVGSNWQWLWTTALVPVAGWMWKRRAARRRMVAR